MDVHTVPATTSPATFLAPGEPVLERRWQRKHVRILMPDGPKLYIRLQPSSLESRLSADDAERLAVSAGLEPMRRTAGALGYSTERNAYGAVSFHCTAELECLCLTQLHYDYELWGIDAHHLSTGHQGEAHRANIDLPAIEEVFSYTLGNYLSAAERLGLEPPLRLECGLSGVEGDAMTSNGAAGGGEVGERNLVWETTLSDHEADVAVSLHPFFEFLRQKAGRLR